VPRWHEYHFGKDANKVVLANKKILLFFLY
jgi:hypothetical protein